MSAASKYAEGIAAAFAARGVRSRTKTGRSRTPHADAASDKLKRLEKRKKYHREYQRRRRASVGVRTCRVVRERDLKAPEEPARDRHRLTVRHRHTCVTPSCRKPYRCDNVCDPVDEGLKNSICPGCFEAAVTATMGER